MFLAAVWETEDGRKTSSLCSSHTWSCLIPGLEFALRICPHHLVDPGKGPRREFWDNADRLELWIDLAR